MADIVLVLEVKRVCTLSPHLRDLCVILNIQVILPRKVLQILDLQRTPSTAKGWVIRYTEPIDQFDIDAGAFSISL